MKRARDPDQIRGAIDARGLSLREMGLLCECSDGTIRFVMAGKSTNPTLARRFAKVLRRPLDELFADVASSEEQDTTEQDAVA